MECYHIILENVRKCWDQKVSVEYKFPLQWNIFKVVNGGQGEIILKSEVANFFDLHSNGKTDLASYIRIVNVSFFPLEFLISSYTIHSTHRSSNNTSEISIKFPEIFI